MKQWVKVEGGNRWGAVEILTSGLFPAILDGGFITTSKDFYDTLSSKALLSSHLPLQCTGTQCATSQQQLGTKFWIIQTQPAFPLDCSKHSQVLVSLPDYILFLWEDGQLSPLDAPCSWLYCLPGSLWSPAKSKSCCTSCLSLPFSFFFLFAGQSNIVFTIGWPPCLGRMMCRTPWYQKAN